VAGLVFGLGLPYVDGLEHECLSGEIQR
jgi:hypothetical protein